MDSSTMKGEISRLVLKKHNLEKQEAALRKILEIVEKQLLGLEVEGYQLASDTRMKEEPAGDESTSEPEIEIVRPKERKSPEREDLNSTELDLDNRLDEMLSGQFFVEEDDEEETEDLMLL